MAPPKKQPSPAAAAASAFRPQQAVSTAAGGAASLAKKDQHQQSQSQQQASSQSKPSSSASSTTTSSSSLRNAQDAQEILSGIWNNYVDHTPQRVKLVDAFMAFLVVVGVLQFVYCVIAGNYPFNAFLSGFSATVGQFVLTASLRIQTNPDNKADFQGISHERAFADFVFGSMILHFFCVNFIN